MCCQIIYLAWTDRDHSEKQGSVGAVGRALANPGPSESGIGSQALPTTLHHFHLQQAARPDPLTVGQMEWWMCVCYFLSWCEPVGMTAHCHQWHPIRYILVAVASLAQLQLPFEPSSEQTLIIIMFVWAQFRIELEKNPQSAVVTHTGVYTAIGALRHASVLSCTGFQN